MKHVYTSVKAFPINLCKYVHMISYINTMYKYAVTRVALVELLIS